MIISNEELRYPEELDKSIFWIDNSLIILLKDDKFLELENCYLADLTFDLDSKYSENITIVGNNKVWK